MEKANLNSQVVGNVGLYFVCYKLSCLGWNVMPTARNAKGIDVVIYNQDATQKYTVQIKSLSKPSPVPLGKHLNNLFGDFFIICRNVTSENPECFILKPEEVRQLAFKGKTTMTSGINYWFQPKQYATPEFKEKWDRIGRGAIDSTISDQALPPKPTS
jgi:hypothetical protein